MRDIVQPSRSLTAFVEGALTALHGFRRIHHMACADARSSEAVERGFRRLSRRPIRALGLAGAALVFTTSGEPAAAQFGLFPGASSYRYHRARRAVRPPAPPVASPEVPLPVPRPSFPTDLPAEPPKIVAPPPAPVPVKPPDNPTIGAPSPGVAPKPMPPGVAPSGARLGEAPGQPDDDAGCPARLKARGVDVEAITIGPQSDARCTIVQAVRLSGLAAPGGRIEFPDRPTLACVSADAFALYVRDLLSPLAKGTFGVPVGAVWTGPGFECRSRDHVVGAKLSAHGQGLAIDIAQIKLVDGRMLAVGESKDPVDDAFQTASRAAACGYFHTVLGPGSDSYHRTHWHFDLEVRGARGDSKYCR